MLRYIILLLALLPWTLFAQSSVWRISKNDRSLYIGGTCHLLRSSDYPLPAEFELAYAIADTLVFEMDPATANTSDFALKLLSKANYQDRRSLKSVLSKKVYNALAEQCARSGLSIEALNKMKPSMVIMTLLVQELTTSGVTEEGVDLHFYKRALSDNKRTRSLETPEFQIDLITSIGEGIENEIVLYGLEDINRVQKRFEKLIHAWRTGNMAELEANFIAHMRNYPKLYSKILVDRNLKWTIAIKKYLKSPETELILVGVAHLAGEKGLLSLLQKKGYTIEQLAAPD